MAPKDDIRAKLRRDDRSTLDDRAARVIEVREIFPEPEGGMFVTGSPIAVWAFQDTRLAYIAGLWLPTIVMCFTAIGQHLAACLFGAGDNDVKGMPLEELIRKAYEAGTIDEMELQDLKALFTRGDIYVKFKEPGEFADKMVKASHEGMDYEDLFHEDARFILAVTGQYFSRHCAMQS